jgi:uncharacterized protein (DUF58 family)
MFARAKYEQGTPSASKLGCAPTGDQEWYGVEASVSELAALRTQGRELDLRRPKRVTSPMAGSYRSPFRGRGMEFAEVRAYVPGDEVRHIDWRVTARTGKPHSKLFDEERERPVVVLTDARSPMRFGTRTCFKSVAAARWAARLVWEAAGRGDRVGGVTLTDENCRGFRLRRSRPGTNALITGLAEATATPCAETAASLADAIVELRRIACVGAQVFILSDFTDLDATARRHLKQLTRFTETSCILVHDPLEAAPPAPGEYCVSNGPDVIAIGTRSGSSREIWGASFSARKRELERLCRDSRAALGVLSTAQDPSARTIAKESTLPPVILRTEAKRGQG